MIHISSKTEQKALNALEAIIDEHPTMDYKFNSHDSEMSWDGFIYLYKENSQTQSKDEFDGRVPVQIKGHYDKKQVYINASRIDYPVQLNDLKAYATEKGVLYFLIFINGNNREVFYSSLFPSKIADYLDKAKIKGNSAKISINFNKLKKQVDELFYIVKQFSDEAKKQGSAYTPLVQNRIRIDELEKLKRVNMSIVGAGDVRTAIKRLASGDVCIYGGMEDDKYDRPIEWVDNSRFYAGKDVSAPVSVGEEVFYDAYKVVIGSDETASIVLSPNLHIKLSEGKCVFHAVTTLKNLYRDARFLLQLQKHESLKIASNEIEFKNPKMASEFEIGLQYIVDLYETLEMIGFDVDIHTSDYSEKQNRQLAYLMEIKRGLHNSHLPEYICKCDWKFGDKDYPLLTIRKPDGTNELASAIFSDKVAVFLPNENDEQGRGYKMPLFCYQDISAFSNLYLYDYDALRRQIDSCDINEFTAEALLECALKMISIFDAYGKEQFLELADHLLDSLVGIEDEVLIFLNKMQIKKRISGLNNDDILALEKIQNDSAYIQFGKNVLLGNKELAENCFKQLPIELKNHSEKYPIYKLFLDL